MSLSPKDAYLLEAAAYEAGGGLYPGERWEQAPKRFGSLYKRGLVDTYIPHNPSHKERAVITEAGRKALAEYRKVKP